MKIKLSLKKTNLLIYIFTLFISFIFVFYIFLFLYNNYIIIIKSTDEIARLNQNIKVNKINLEKFNLLLENSRKTASTSIENIKFNNPF